MIAFIAVFRTVGGGDLTRPNSPPVPRLLVRLISRQPAIRSPWCICEIYRVFYALSRYIGRFFIWALVSISITNLLFPTQVLQSTFISLQPDVCSSWCIYEIYCIFCALSCYIGRFLVWALVQIPITNLPFPTWVLQSTPYIFTTRLLFLLFYTWNLPPIVLQRQFFCSTISRTSNHQPNSHSSTPQCTSSCPSLCSSFSILSIYSYFGQTLWDVYREIWADFIQKAVWGVVQCYCWDHTKCSILFSHLILIEITI